MSSAIKLPKYLNSFTCSNGHPFTFRTNFFGSPLQIVMTCLLCVHTIFLSSSRQSDHNSLKSLCVLCRLLYILARWIHDYQDACVDRLENFITGGESSSARLLSTNRLDMSKASSITSPPPELHGPVFPPPTSSSLADGAASSAAATDATDNKGDGSKPGEPTTSKGPTSVHVQPPPSSENSAKSTPNKSHCVAT